MVPEKVEPPEFNWAMLGDVAEGRPNLGQTTHVTIYRLMQFTLLDRLTRKLGKEEANRIFFEAGMIAGKHFYENLITQRGSFADFTDDVQEQLRRLGIGVFRVEKAQIEDLHFTLTVAEDLECSGLPVSGDEVCTYDEGFLAGLLGAHTQRSFDVKEVDCWCTGARICRFEAKPAG